MPDTRVVVTSALACSHYDHDRKIGRLLADHLGRVGADTGHNARHLPAPAWGEKAGRIHDLGKNHERWQAYLMGTVGQIGHKDVGAVYAFLSLGTSGLPIAYLVAGHHGGLPDYSAAECTGDPLEALLPPTVPAGRAPTSDEAQAITAAQRLVDDYTRMPLPPSLLDLSPKPGEALALPFGKTGAPSRFAPAFWTRMLYSAMVDADFLDAERFYNPDKAADRAALSPEENLAKIRELKALFDAHMDRHTRPRAGANMRIHRLRQMVLATCRDAGRNTTLGLKSLNVPTGLGKTLSSMAFALEHALAHGLERIIYVAPYISIIDQTAQILRGIFGDDNVVEHHSGTDPENDNHRARLAAENWDAPFIVTTAVQLFESLYGNKPSKCRKLHNMTGAVLILDEAQSVPPGCVGPIAHAIEQLTLHCRSTVVLATATQPGFHQAFPGLTAIADIMGTQEAIADLHAQVRRVRLELPENWEPVAWREVAAIMRGPGHERSLAIVDSRQDALDLFGLIRDLPGAYHLSTYMCPAHRRAVIAAIRARLEARQDTRVVSTRLIEAGVDLDFPRVLRALCGLDSLIQAAGRCNREGLLEALGVVRVFVPIEPRLSGHLLQAAEVTREILDRYRDDPFCPEAIDRFFAAMYWRKGADGLDERQVLDLLGVDTRTLARSAKCLNFRYQFATAASQFNMIDDKEAAIVVRYGDGEDVINRLLAGADDRKTLRSAAQYSASVPKRLIPGLAARGIIAMTEAGIHVQVHPDAYGLEVGWVGA